MDRNRGSRRPAIGQNRRAIGGTKFPPAGVTLGKTSRGADRQDIQGFVHRVAERHPEDDAALARWIITHQEALG